MAAVKKIYLATLKYLVALLMLAILVLITTNVGLRYFLNTGLHYADEISRFMFVWLTFIGALLVLYEGGHIGMDSLARRMPPVVRRIFFLLARVLMLYLTWLFLEGSWRQTIINLRVGAPSTGLSMSFFYGVGVFFSAFSALFLIWELGRFFRGRIPDSQLFRSLAEDEAEARRLVDEHAAPVPDATAAGVLK